MFSINNIVDKIIIPTDAIIATDTPQTYLTQSIRIYSTNILITEYKNIKEKYRHVIDDNFEHVLTVRDSNMVEIIEKGL